MYLLLWHYAFSYGIESVVTSQVNQTCIRYVINKLLFVGRLIRILGRSTISLRPIEYCIRH